jgi:HSP20 family protein
MGGLHYKNIKGQLGSVSFQLTNVQFGGGASDLRWSPPMNAYRCDSCFILCLELAGVSREEIDLTVDGRRLVLHGRRSAPEPDSTCHQPTQVLAMEIDWGEFHRELTLPADVERENVRAEKKDGLLWIFLPLRGDG